MATLGGSWFWDGTSYVWSPDYEGDSPTGDPPDPPDPGSNEPQIIEWTGGTWMIDAQPMEFTGGITYSDFVPDVDGDGLPDDLDPYPYESSNNSQWFEGGTWVIHGAYQSWEGAWYASFEPLPDNDGDDLPDDWDPYPQDGNNYSFWFAGGTFTRHDLTLALRAGYHAGTGADDNQDGFPDELDDIFLNPSSYGTLQFWAGGTFLINGAYNTYPAAHYFAPTVSDQDGDGIPDELDAAPDDAWNGTWFHWAGGTYPVDGVVTAFPPRVYGGLFADTDGDTLPDAADPYPADPANNSEWWSGGSFPVDGVIQEFAGQWHRANAGDGDGDGIPEDVDPYPGDPNNPTIPQFTWQGGIFRIDGVEQTFQAGEYPGAWADADADGLPDSLDPHPSDPANNSAWWTGGTFSIDGQSQVLSARWHRANAGDADGDGIPEDIDPYPGDALNPTPVSYTWAGGVFRINGIEQTLAGGTFAGLWSDGDGDQIPDPADPFPADAANNSLWWLGGTWLVEGVNQDFQACWVAANAPDQDGDGIPDALDPHPQDSWNGTGWWWPETASITVKIQNQNITFARQHYLTAWSDVDGDGLPDIADPLPQDFYNGNDSDGDGLPDSQEALYAGVLDAENPADAQVVRADGVSYLRAHLYNGQAVAAGRADLVLPLTSLIPLERDSDQDRVGDRYEVAHGLNPFDNLDAVSGSQEDRVLIAEKAAAGLDPWSEVLPEEYANITGQDPAGVYHDAEMSYAENDWDADGVSNMDEWLLFQTSLRDPGQRPDDSQILTAMVEGRVSQTTWLNYYHLLNSNPGGDCTCGGPGCPVSGCACDSYCEVWSPHYCGCGGISCYIYDCFCTETCGGGGAGGGSGGVGSGGTGPCDCVNTAPGSNVACTCSETDPTCDPNTLCGSPQTGEKCSAACPSSPESCTCSAPCAEDPSMPSGCGLGDTSCSCQREGCTASPPDPNDEYSEGTPCNCVQPTCNPVATNCVCDCSLTPGGCAPSVNPTVDHATCIAGTQPDLPDGQVYTGVHPCSAVVAVEFEFKLERQGSPGPDEVRNYVQMDSRLQNGTNPDLRTDITITAQASFDLGVITTTRGSVDTLNPTTGVCGDDGKFETTLSTREKAPALKVQSRGGGSTEHNMLPALYKNQFHITGYSTPSEGDPRFTGARVTHTTLTTGSGATRRVYDITSPRAAKSDFLKSIAVEGEGYFEDGTHAVVSNRTTPGTSNPIETTTTITTNNLGPKGTRNRDLVADNSCAITRSSGNGIVIPDAAFVHVVGQVGNWCAIDQVSSTETGGVYHIDLYKGFDRAAADLISTDTDVILMDY